MTAVRISLAAAGLALLALACLAQPAPPPPAQGKPPAVAEKKEAPKDKDVYLDHADRIRVNNKTHDVEVSGDVVLRHEDARFFADLIKFNTKTKLGTATGSPRFQDKQSTVTAQRVEINFKERWAAFAGGVAMITQKQPEPPPPGTPAKPGEPAAPAAGEQVAKPAPAPEQPSAKSDQTKPNGKDEEQKDRPLESYWEEKTTITCDRLEYSYRDKRAVASGAVKAVQKDQTAYGDRAVYDEQEDTLLVTGNVRLHNEQGENFRCDRVMISLKDDWLEAEGGVASHFVVKEEEEEEGQAQQPGAKNGTQNGGAKNGAAGKNGAPAKNGAPDTAAKNGAPAQPEQPPPPSPAPPAGP